VIRKIYILVFGGLGMGRIKSTLVKRTATKLMSGIDSFSGEFEDNKKILGNSMPSKQLRNKIAGYIARLKRQQISQVNTQ
jgi:ribosomal protein S17E